MGDKVEDGPIVVVPKEGVKLDLGVPYNCKTDTTTAPADPIDWCPDDVEGKLPIRSLKYNLNHIRETKEKEQTLSIGLSVVLETLIGLKLDIGSISYDSKYNSKLDTEHIVVYYYREDHVDRLLPTKAVSDAIKESK